LCFQARANGAVRGQVQLRGFRGGQREHALALAGVEILVAIRDIGEGT